MIRVTSSRRAAVVQRTYEAEEEACAQAIKVLLKKSLPSTEGGPETAPHDAERRSSEFGATDKSSK